jgi:hypothetical protein
VRLADIVGQLYDNMEEQSQSFSNEWVAKHLFCGGLANALGIIIGYVVYLSVRLYLIKSDLHDVEILWM